MVNYHAGTTGNGIVPNNTVHQIVAGLEIARAPATSGLNLAASNACVTNTYKKIGVGSSFNALINSGIVHPTGVLLVPFIASVQNLGFGDSQWKSPFDTCPTTTPHFRI